ncbi:MAG: hypothetical protein ACJ75G_09240 [Gaiellaceae bacterium]
MFGLLAAILGKSGLGYWSNIWSIIGGLIAALILGFAVSREIWKWFHRPRLVIEFGNGKEFNRRLSTSSPDLVYFTSGREIEAAFAKVLKVRETKGNLARDVAIRVVDVRTPGERPDLPINLQWMHSVDETTDIQPKGHRMAMLQRLISSLHEDGRYWNTNGALDTSARLQQVTVELLIAGKRHRRAKLAVADAWPGLQLRILTKDVPLPDPMLYPRVAADDEEQGKLSRLWRRVLSSGEHHHE